MAELALSDMCFHCFTLPFHMALIIYFWNTAHQEPAFPPDFHSSPKIQWQFPENPKTHLTQHYPIAEELYNWKVLSASILKDFTWRPRVFDRYKLAPEVSYPHTIQARTREKAKQVKKQGMLGGSSKSWGVPRI